MFFSPQLRPPHKPWSGSEQLSEIQRAFWRFCFWGCRGCWDLCVWSRSNTGSSPILRCPFPQPTRFQQSVWVWEDGSSVATSWGASKMMVWEGPLDLAANRGKRRPGSRLPRQTTKAKGHRKPHRTQPVLGLAWCFAKWNLLLRQQV